MKDAADRREDRIASAWQAFRDEDARLHAPPHLEAAVMAALREPRQRQGVARTPIFAAIAASIAVVATMWTLTSPRARSAPPLLEARAMPFAPLTPAISRTPIRTPRRSMAARTVRSVPRAEETIVILMMFEPLPASQAETLQLVRLRVPGEALLALGLPPFEPDASGLVDIDMLVGEDGLPKNIRKIRVAQQEER